jgi:hypothetical protein
MEFRKSQIDTPEITMLNMLLVLFFISFLAASSSHYFEFDDIEKVKDSDSEDIKDSKKEFFKLKDSINTELQKLDDAKRINLKRFLDVYQQHKIYYIEKADGEEEERCHILDWILSDYLKRKLRSDFREISDHENFVFELGSMLRLYLKILSRNTTRNIPSYESFFDQPFKDSPTIFKPHMVDLLKSSHHELFLLLALTYLKSLSPTEAFAIIFQNNIPLSIDGTSSLVADIEDFPLMCDRIYEAHLYQLKVYIVFLETKQRLEGYDVKNHEVSKSLDLVLYSLYKIVLPKIQERKWLSVSPGTSGTPATDPKSPTDSKPDASSNSSLTENKKPPTPIVYNWDSLKIDNSGLTDPEKEKLLKYSKEFNEYTQKVNAELAKLPMDDLRLANINKSFDFYLSCFSALFEFFGDPNIELAEKYDVIILVLRGFLRQELQQFPQINAQLLVENISSMFFLKQILVNPKFVRPLDSYRSIFLDLSKETNTWNDEEISFLKKRNDHFWHDVFIYAALDRLSKVSQKEVFALLFGDDIPLSINGKTRLDETLVGDYSLIWDYILEYSRYSLKACVFEFGHWDPPTSEKELNEDQIVQKVVDLLPRLVDFTQKELCKRNWLSPNFVKLVKDSNKIESKSAILFYNFDDLKVDDSNPKNQKYKRILLEFALKVNTQLAKLPKADPRLVNIKNAFDNLLDYYKSYTSSMIAGNLEEVERCGVALTSLKGYLMWELRQFFDVKTFSVDLARMFWHLMLLTHPSFKLPSYRSIFDDLSKVSGNWSDDEIAFLDKWKLNERFWYDIFYYAILNHVSKLPKDTAFEIIFQKEIPLSIDGQPLLTKYSADDHSQVWDFILDNFLSSMKQQLFKAAELERASSGELNDDHPVKKFSDLVPKLVDFILQKIPKRKWLSPSPKPLDSNSDKTNSHIPQSDPPVDNKWQQAIKIVLLILVIVLLIGGGILIWGKYFRQKGVKKDVA